MQMAKRTMTGRGITVPYLNAWRATRGLSQVELATRADLSLSTVSRTEQGGKVSLPNAVKLARALGVSVNDLKSTDPLGIVEEQPKEDKS
jgi:transcriptional regulator with XRE-family HTH domain